MNIEESYIDCNKKTLDNLARIFYTTDEIIIKEKTKRIL